MLFSLKRKKIGWWSWLQVGVVVTFIAGFLLAGLVLAVKTVEIIDEGEAKVVTTFAWTVDSALKAAGIEYTLDDQIMPNPEKLLKDGVRIEILRAEEVILEADGHRWVIRAVKTDPLELLLREGITLGILDQIDISENDEGVKKIKVTRITEELVEERLDLPYDTFKQPDNKLVSGQRKTLKAGKNGVLLKKIRIVKADGVEASRSVISTRILLEPKRSVVAYGIADNIAPAARGVQGNIKAVMIMEATAYTHTGNKTATGIYPYKGVIAVDPKVIPLGSRLYVEGYGYCEAQDTGGAIKGDRIDIFLDTKKECVNWGRKAVQVYLLD